MFQALQAEALKILLQYQTVIKFKEKITKVPSNYASVIQTAILYELSEEHAKLSALFNNQSSLDSIKRKFLKLCNERELENEGTALSFAALFEGHCNLLYWQLALLIFEPKNIVEMLSILLPRLSKHLNLLFLDGLNDKTDNENLRDRVLLKLETTNLDLLPAALEPTFFSQVVIAEDIFFSLESIKALPFYIHQQLFTLLDSYPALKRKLYSHNDDLKELAFNLHLMQTQGLTPKEAIILLSKELRRAGTRNAGTEYAGGTAIKACNQFGRYLENLPPSFREQLLALKKEEGSKETLASIMAHLDKGFCVEIAATNLDVLCINNHNQTHLNQQPSLSIEETRAVNRRYRKPIEIVGFEGTMALPSAIKDKVLEEVEITSTYDYVDLLINLPTEQYQSFLSKVRIKCYPALPDELSSNLGMFNAEQKEAFFAALLQEYKKFGNKYTLLSFAIRTKDLAFIRQTLGLFSSKEQAMNYFNRRSNEDNNIIYYIARHGDGLVFNLILGDLSEIEQSNLLKKHRKIFHISAQNNNFSVWREAWKRINPADSHFFTDEKDQYNMTLLHWVMWKGGQQEIFKVFNCFSGKEETAKALAQKSNDGNTALHWLAKNQDENTVKAVLDRFEIDELLVYLKTPNHLYGETPLMFTLARPKIWNQFWQRIPLTDKIEMLEQPLSSLGWSSFLQAIIASAKNPRIINECLAILSDKNLLTSKNDGGLNALYYFVKNEGFERLDLVCETVDNGDKWAFLFDKDSRGNFYILLLAQELQLTTWLSLWNEFTEDERLMLLDIQNENGSRLLHFVAQRSVKEVWQHIWACYKELYPSRLQVLLEEKNQLGKTALAYAAENNHREAMRDMLVALSFDKGHPHINLTQYPRKLDFFFEYPHDFFINYWSALPNDDEKISILRQRDIKDQSILHVFYFNLFVIKKIVDFLSPEQLLSLFTQEDFEGNTPLSCMVKNGSLKCLEYCWKKISLYEGTTFSKEKIAIELLKIALDYSHTPIVKFMFNQLPHFSLYQLLQTKNKTNVLYAFVLIQYSSFELIEYCFEHLSTLEQSSIRNMKNEDGDNLMHAFLRSYYRGDLVANFLRLYPLDDLLALIVEENITGETPIQIATQNSSYLKILLQALPQNVRFDYLSKPNRYGWSALQQAAKNKSNEAWDVVYQLLPDKDIAKLTTPTTLRSQFAFSFWRQPQNEALIEPTPAQASMISGFIGFD